MQLLEALSIDPDQRIKIKIANDSNTPISILEAMAQSEFYQPKLLQEIRRVLASDYPKNSVEYKTTADVEMSYLKHEFLYPANISINVENWMKIIETQDILEVMTESISEEEGYNALHKVMVKLESLWQELLPELPNNIIKQVIDEVIKTLVHINSNIKHNDFGRAVSVALIGNPNTPINLLHKLKNQLVRPYIPLNKKNSDRDVITALVYNAAISEEEREKYFKQLLTNGYSEHLAKNPQTPTFILEKLIENNRSKYAVAENSNASANLLRKLATENNEELLRRIANNPSTPTDLLIELANRPVEQTINNVKSIRKRVLNNSSFSILNSYQILSEQEEKKEIEQANQILVKRTDSPYALARVLETGDQNIKISAATNPKTPIQVLEQLAKDQDETVRSVMAQNLNLPLNTLLELAEDSSVKVRLWLAYKYTHSKIKTPVQLLEKLAKDESGQVRERVAEHPDTPEELLVQLANDSSIEVKRKLAANLNTPVTVLNRLGLEENIVNKRNPNTPPMVLAQAVKRMNSKALAEFIKHPVKGTQMPGETLAELANHQAASVRYRVAAHPNTPTRILEQLAGDSYIATVRAVASNPNTPPGALEYLADNPDLTTRLSIARHPNTPAKVLRQIVENAQRSANAPNTTKDTLKSGLFGDAYDLLIAIAANSKTPIDALEIIARREFVSPTRDSKSILPPRTDNDVIKSLVYNPSLTPELLSILTQDPCGDVRVALTRHPNLTEELWIKLAEDQDISVRKAVASKINAPINILETLAQDNVTDVRLEVAGNNKTPSQVLEQLSQDTEATVRTKVAANPNTSINILKILAEDESLEVRRAVANNFNTPEVIKNSLKDLLPATKSNNQTISPTLRGLSRIYNPDTDDLPTLLSEYTNSDVAFVKFVSWLHPLTPTEILEAGANSVSWLERYAVADNPNTPTEIKQQLTQDSNQIVRAVARDKSTS